MKKGILKKKRYNMERELYLAVKRDHLPIMDAVQRFGLSRSSIYRIIANFEAHNPQEVSFMKKQVQKVLPADYLELQKELSALKRNWPKNSSVPTSMKKW